MPSTTLWIIRTVPLVLGIALVGALVAALAGAPGASAAGASAPGPPAWGAMASTCAAPRLAASRAAGLSVVEVDASWARYLPERAGEVDAGYAAELRERVARCHDAGFRVVLAPGTQYPPPWVRASPGATYRDQRGRAPAEPVVDVVFSATVRAAQADYLRRLVADLPGTRLDAIRVGTNAAGELGYPEPTGDGPTWWAFGDAPQQGTGLAAGAARTPMPGWIPGRRTWNGRAVTAGDARDWFGWYARALVGSWADQVGTLRAAGFTGSVHLPVAGRGVLPADLDAATGALLDGTADRDGSLGRGLDYVDQFPVAASRIPGQLVVDLTSVDDAGAVAARAVGEDLCRPSDAAAGPAGVERWSNLRFARAQAARAGLPVVGENPGPPGPTTGGAAGADSEREQVRRSPAYARACGLAAFLVAFEDDLYTGRSGITLDDYRSATSGAAPAGRGSR